MGIDRTSPLLLDTHLFGDPAAMREAVGPGPIHSVRMPDGMGAWLVTGYQEARRVLTDRRLVRDSRAAAAHHQPFLQGIYGDGFFPHSMVFNDRPDHTRMKQVVSRAFTPRSIERMREGVQRINDDLFDALAGRTTFDVMDSLALPLPNRVICEWFDVPHADRGEFAARCEVVTGVNVSTGAEDMAAAGRWFDEYITDLMERRRIRPGDDMISAMLAAEEGGARISDLEMRANIFLMLIGSVETAVNMMSNGILALLRNPSELAALRADPALVTNALEEILRFDPPVTTVMYHFATETFDVAGVTVEAGDHVAVSTAAANHDPRQFPEPDRFRVDRADGPHVSMSHGPHFCLGAPLARLEGELFFRTLLRRLPHLELATPAADLTWKESFLVHRLERLPVICVPSTGRRPLAA